MQGCSNGRAVIARATAALIVHLYRQCFRICLVSFGSQTGFQTNPWNLPCDLAGR